jgi:hypothetical protein
MSILILNTTVCMPHGSLYCGVASLGKEVFYLNLSNNFEYCSYISLSILRNWLL